MGVKFIREYNDIISDFTDLLINIDNINNLFGMSQDIWKYISKANKRKYIETLSDDIFFALGTEAEFSMDCIKIVYNIKQHTIEIFNDSINIGVVNLI